MPRPENKSRDFLDPKAVIVEIKMNLWRQKTKSTKSDKMTKKNVIQNDTDFQIMNLSKEITICWKNEAAKYV